MRAAECLAYMQHLLEGVRVRKAAGRGYVKLKEGQIYT